jgi:hypothetical protein
VPGISDDEGEMAGDCGTVGCSGTAADGAVADGSSAGAASGIDDHHGAVSKAVKATAQVI